MKSYSPLAFFLPLSLLALQEVKPAGWVPPSEQRSWTMTSSFGIGYRYDRQKLDEPTSLTYLENLNSLEMNFLWMIAWERVLLKCTADYGWLLNGDLHFKGFSSPFLPAQQDFSTFHIGSGYHADLLPSIGCRIKFWTFFCGKGSLSFIPSLGYAYSHFNAYPRGRNSISSGTQLTTLEYTRPIQQDWFGPSVEGRIAFSWREERRLDLFYQYTHLDFRQTYSQAVSQFSLAGAGTANTSTLRVSSKGDTFRTQLGGVDFSYRSPCRWQLGSRFEGSATWSKTGKSILRLVQDSFFPSASHTETVSKETLDLDWTRYLLQFYASYWF